IVNLCDLPARITSWRLPPVPISDEMEQSKNPWRSPSTMTISTCASASASWPRCARKRGEIEASRIVQQRLQLLYSCGECQRADCGVVIVQRQHVASLA